MAVVTYTAHLVRVLPDESKIAESENCTQCHQRQQPTSILTSQWLTLWEVARNGTVISTEDDSSVVDIMAVLHVCMSSLSM